jgi:hypothetical protein
MPRPWPEAGHCKAVEDGRTKFVPANWDKTYFNWMNEHPALVHFAPALVGPPDPGLVRAGRRTSCSWPKAEAAEMARGTTTSLASQNGSTFSAEECRN